MERDWTEADEQDSADLIQAMLDRDAPAVRVMGDPAQEVKTIIRASDGTRWLGVNDHGTVDLTDAVRFNARIMAWYRRQATPIGY